MLIVNSRETTSLSSIQCQRCGQSNDAKSIFCRNCGDRLAALMPEQYNAASPRPYTWKTDEFQTQSEARPFAQNIPPPTPTVISPAQQHQYQHQPAYPLVNTGLRLDYRGPQDLTGHYRCPYCATTYLPIMERRVSTAGWITLALLLVFTFIFFWIGLLIKEDVAICPVCKRRVS